MDEEQSTLEASVTKSSRLGPAVALAAVALAVILLGGFGRSNPAADLTSSDPDAGREATAGSGDPRLDVETAEAPTTPGGPLETTDGSEGPTTPMPDRGAFRAALVATLTRHCEALVDGPEPGNYRLYQMHAACVEEALVDIDNRCRLAATVFYVMPGDDALNEACADTPMPLPREPAEPSPSTNFRESVRQTMILTCERGRTDHIRHEAYYEFERCLQAIAGDLDRTCYLAAQAQFASPRDEELRSACRIDPELELAVAID